MVCINIVRNKIKLDIYKEISSFMYTSSYPPYSGKIKYYMIPNIKCYFYLNFKKNILQL
jgi:hypothetical protein